MKNTKLYLIGSILLVLAAGLGGSYLVKNSRFGSADVEIASFSISPEGILELATEEVIPHGYYTTGVLYDGSGGSKDYGSASGDLTPFGKRFKGSQSSAWPMERDPAVSLYKDWKSLLLVKMGSVYHVTEGSPLVLFDYVNDKGERQKGTIELRKQASRLF